jgi:hypothetical protein
VRTRIACLPEFPLSFASFSFILFYFSGYPMGFVTIAVSQQHNTWARRFTRAFTYVRSLFFTLLDKNSETGGEKRLGKPITPARCRTRQFDLNPLLSLPITPFIIPISPSPIQPFNPQV